MPSCSDSAVCAARIYRFTPSPPPKAGGAQQQLVDRLSRHHWKDCALPAAQRCRRCQLPLCAEHMHSHGRRCERCEREFLVRRRATNGMLAIGYSAVVFAVGVASLALGYRLGLFLVVPTMAAAPMVARFGRVSAARRRFLREHCQRPAQLPRAWSRPGD